jgi:hypothetical protein
MTVTICVKQYTIFMGRPELQAELNPNNKETNCCARLNKLVTFSLKAGIISDYVKQ